MVDIYTVAERARLMSRIGQKNTTPEKRVRKLLSGLNLRYRLHNKKLPGKPDIVLPKYKTTIFVHGCFWHSHNCKKGRSRPKTNRDFWRKKFKDNKKRDLRIKRELRKDHWRVITVWECQTTDPNRILKVISKVLPMSKVTVS